MIKIIQIAGFGKYFGSGHLVRQRLLQKIINSLGYKTDLISIERKSDILNLSLNQYDIIIKDSRDSNHKIDKFIGNKPLITFDDYYIPNFYKGYRFYWNSLPSLENFGNIKSLSYLIIEDYLNDLKGKSNPVTYDILVNFGQLDPFNYCSKIAKFFNRVINENKVKSLNDKRILFVLPSNIFDKVNSNKVKTVFANFDIIKSGSNDFKNIVINSKNIITHFGLFLFESIKLKKQVFIVSPTKYHERLSNNYFGKIHFSKNGKIAEDDLLNSLLSENNFTYKFDLKIMDSELINDLVENLIKFLSETIDKREIESICPICNKEKLKIVWSEKNFHLFYCKSCHTIVKEILNFEKMNEDSGKSYYFEEYKRVYGKTYLEDRDNIKKLNFNRLSKIIPKIMIMNRNENTIRAIDFGGALGFFLDDLKDELEKLNKKMEGYVIESNSYAKEFCKNKNYQVYSNFEELKESKNYQLFDLISYWFCFEHLHDIKNEIKNAYNLLRKDGLLCLSFPSSFGPMFKFKKNRNLYFNSRPKDHFYDFNPNSLKKLLEKNGFKVYKIVVPNIYFERFSSAHPLISRIIGKKLYLKICKIIKFGDICEIYAIKI